MNTSFLNSVGMTVLGAGVLCGCASNPPKVLTPTPAPVPTASLPRDPVIDAYVGVMRADLSDGKVRTINSVMQLSDDEAKVFWPIYQDYESESFDIGDRRVDLIRRFAAAQKSGTMASGDATELATGYFAFEQQRLDLLKKYHEIIATELSPVRASQFTQIEHRVGTIVDLSIAAEMPLIQAARRDATP